jgi:cytoskeleton protein RodZ
MEPIASELKAQRESRNISLAQIAADTHISLHYLESLEEGRFHELPGGMYNRAFLRAYCERLNLDQSEILQRYESEVFPNANKPAKTKSPAVSSIKIPPVAIWSLMLLISAASIFLNRKWIFPVFSPYFSSSSGMQDHYALPKQPSPAPIRTESSPSVSTAKETPTLPTNENPSLTPAQELPPTSSLQSANAPMGPLPNAKSTAPIFRVEITGIENCWISIHSDGASIFSKTIKPGEVQSFSAEKKLLLIVGNASGISLKINGKAAKSLGKSGEVVKIIINESTLPDLIDRSNG